MARASGESHRAPSRILVLQESSHDTLQVPRLDPAERVCQPIGHQRSVSGETEESVERFQVPPLDCKRSKRERATSCRALEFVLQKSLAVLGSRRESVTLGQ